MDPDVANFAIVAAVIVVMIGALSAIVVGLVRALGRKPQERAMPSTVQFDQRFDQLQQSVDAIAVEVERIAEAQRFSAKLLADRGETPSLQR